MRKRIALLLLLGACGVPQAPPLPPPPPAPPPEPPRPAPVLHFEERRQDRDDFLAALDPAGKVAWKVALCNSGHWVPAPGGGAFVVQRTPSGKYTIGAVSTAGEMKVLAEVKDYCPAIRLVDGRIVLESPSGGLRDRTELTLRVLTPAGESLVADVIAGVPLRSGIAFGPHETIAVPLSGGGARLYPLDGAAFRAISPHATHAVAGDRGLLGVPTTAVGFFADGTLVTGAGDGTVSAFDEAGSRLWAFGVQGAVRGITRVDDRRVALTTATGTVALADRDGRLLWERRPTRLELGPAAVTEGRLVLAAARTGVFAYTLAGDLAFSHDTGGEELGDGLNEPPIAVRVEGDQVSATGARVLRFHLGAPHPPVLSTTPIFPLRFERALPGTVRSLLVLGRDDVWALVHAQSPSPGHLFHYDGRRFSRVPMPERDRGKEKFLDDAPPMRGTYLFDALAQGPDGRPWILGRRTAKEIENENFSPGAGLVLEWDGRAFQERRDLFAAFAARRIVTPIARTAAGPVRFFCFGESGQSECLEHDGRAFRAATLPAGVTSVTFTATLEGSPWLLSNLGGPLYRRRGGTWEEVPGGDENRPHGLAGRSARDLWTYGAWSRVVRHFDGERWTSHPVPLARVNTVHVAGPDDVWAGGDALVHFDGKAWSRVGGVPGSVDHVGGVPGGDLWAESGGIWRGKPGSAPAEPASLPLPAARDLDSGAPAPAAPLVLGAPEDRYRAERVTPPPAGKAPFDAARSAGPRDDDDPPPRWAATALTPDGGAFLAGGIAESHDGVRSWPAGEGLLIHRRAGAVTRARASGSLLAVAAVGQDEAWAAGAGGVVVHQRGEVVRRFALASGEWLRAVWAGGPDDVWLAGDGATLIHYDGAVFRKLDLPALAPDASITAVSGARDRLLVVGPSGIFRVSRR